MTDTSTIHPATIAEARRLREHGMGWAWIASRLHVVEYGLRCALEPWYREERRRLARRYDKKIKAERKVIMRRRSANPGRTDHVVHSFGKQPPDEVLAERDRYLDAMLEPRSITAELFGDPPSCRSALGKRNG